MSKLAVQYNVLSDGSIQRFTALAIDPFAWLRDVLRRLPTYDRRNPRCYFSQHSGILSASTRVIG